MSEVQPLPASLDAERGLLASLILEPGPSAKLIANRLNPEAFSDPRHRTIYDVLYRWPKPAEPVNFVWLSEELIRLGALEDVGGRDYLDTLYVITPSVAVYLPIVLERWHRRQVIHATRARQNHAYDLHSDSTEFDPNSEFGPDGTHKPGEQPQAPEFGDIVPGRTVREVIAPLPPTIVNGLLCRGEKGELAGGSKSFKTWALIQKGLSIAAGLKWFGMLTRETNVLFLNLEIPKEFFEARVRLVAHALRIDVPDNFYVWHLRSAKLYEPSRWDAFLRELSKRASDIEHPYVTSDPIYKLLGGRNENAAGDVQALLSQLDELIEVVQGSNFFGHHFSKGSQADKDAIDRAAGSGVFQRDPDTILTMTPLEADGCFTVDVIVRNHEPIEKFVIKWAYPIFELERSIDPENLKRQKNAQEKTIERNSDPSVLVHWLGTQHLTTPKLCKRVMDETGMKKTTFYRALEKAFKQKLLIRDGISGTIEVPQKTIP
jgi:hypothetical protein